jgi:hypothetical protein
LGDWVVHRNNFGRVDDLDMKPLLAGIWDALSFEFSTNTLFLPDK